MRVLAIDPGLAGAVAIVTGKKSSNDSLQKRMIVEKVIDMPVRIEKKKDGKIKRYIDARMLDSFLNDNGKFDKIVCERMLPAPNVSGVASFSMGATMGTIKTVFELSGFDLLLVNASYWKNQMQCPANKEAARMFASRYFEDASQWPLKKHDGRAEAALIGAWCIMTQ